MQKNRGGAKVAPPRIFCNPQILDLFEQVAYHHQKQCWCDGGALRYTSVDRHVRASLLLRCCRYMALLHHVVNDLREAGIQSELHKFVATEMGVYSVERFCEVNRAEHSGVSALAGLEHKL